MILLFDRDGRQQMILRIRQEREKIHIRERRNHFLQKFPAEIQRDVTGGCLPQRCRLVNLVFADQHHTARIDDIRCPFHEIAPGAGDFVIYFKIVMDMKARHIKTGIPVHPLNIKIHLGTVGVFRNHCNPLLSDGLRHIRQLFCYIV